MPRAGDPRVPHARVFPGGRLTDDDQISRRKVRRLALEVGRESAQDWRGCIAHRVACDPVIIATRLAHGAAWRTGPLEQQTFLSSSKFYFIWRMGC